MGETVNKNIQYKAGRQTKTKEDRKTWQNNDFKGRGNHDKKRIC